MNLVGKTQGYTRVVHTGVGYFIGEMQGKSNYLNSLIKPIKSTDRYANQITRLQAQEKAFYNKFGLDVNNFGDFKRLLWSKQDIAKKDAECLKNYTNEGIRSRILSQYDATTGMNYANLDVELIGTTIDLSNLFSGSNFNIDKNNSKLSIAPNATILKEVLNKYRNTQKKGGGQYDISNPEVSNRLIQALFSYPELFQISYDNTQLNNISEFIDIGSAGNIWAKDKAWRDEMMKTPSGQKILNQYIDTIKDILVNQFTSSGSSYLKQAAKETFNAKIGSASKEKQWDLLSYFLGGKGYATNLFGVGGEFMTAMIPRYIYHLMGEKTNKNMSIILGDIVTQSRYKDSEILSKGQVKQDVLFFNQFGVQVKNYNQYSLKSASILNTNSEGLIGGNIHLPKLCEYLTQQGIFSPAEAVTFSDFLVNYYFNAGIRQIGEYNSIFETIQRDMKFLFTEIYNLAISDSIPDTLTFYMIGSSFVPASELVKFFSKNKDKLLTTITGPEPIYVPKSMIYGPMGLDNYWDRQPDGTWKSTQENETTYNRIYKDSISFHILGEFQNLLSNFALF